MPIQIALAQQYTPPAHKYNKQKPAPYIAQHYYRQKISTVADKTSDSSYTCQYNTTLYPRLRRGRKKILN
jgi:quinolinate synthase